MGVDVPATQGARASATRIMAMLNQINQIKFMSASCESALS